MSLMKHHDHFNKALIIKQIKLLISKLKSFFFALKKMTALRQAALLTGSFLILLLIGGIASAWLIEREIRQNIDTELSSTHQQLARQIDSIDNIALILPRSSVLFASYKDLNNRIYGIQEAALFKRKGFSNIDLEFDDKKSKSVKQNSFAAKPLHLDEDWRIYTAQVNSGILTVAINLDDRNKVLTLTGQTYLAVSIIVSLLTLTLGLGIGLFNQRRYNKIKQVLEIIANGDLSARISPIKQRDDLDQVAINIDATTQRLELLIQQIKDLSGNIAHDLRTPMARLRAKLETALLSPNKEPAETTIEGALDNIDDMMMTFEAILRISNLSSGEHKNHFVTLSLAKLLNETAEIYAPVIEDSGRYLQINIISDSTINGSRELIIQLLANLIENAIRHTNKGSTIILSCDTHFIQIVDNGPGIVEKYHQRVLEPMYRLESSRNTKGNGLGLALVNSIALVHEAKLSLLNSNTSHCIAKPKIEIKSGLTINIQF